MSKSIERRESLMGKRSMRDLVIERIINMGISLNDLNECNGDADYSYTYTVESLGVMKDEEILDIYRYMVVVSTVSYDE